MTKRCLRITLTFIRKCHFAQLVATIACLFGPETAETGVQPQANEYRWWSLAQAVSSIFQTWLLSSENYVALHRVRGRLLFQTAV